MFRKSVFKYLLISKLFLFVISFNCPHVNNDSNLKFYLWKRFQRSMQEMLHVDNVDSLEDCEALTRKHRGLAFNYAPKDKFISANEGKRNLSFSFVPKERFISEDEGKTPSDLKMYLQHFWNQPQLYFNCHILKCPENGSFKTMTNDTKFNYYSLYENSMATDYSCIPEIGLFVLNIIPESYESASLNCARSQYYCGSLAHVASQKRTEGLTTLLAKYNKQTVNMLSSKVNLAYVGLVYNASVLNKKIFLNSEKENLNCFPYRAWEVGSPKTSLQYDNASCVALTARGSWRSVKCETKLPYVCEILTRCKSHDKGDDI